MDIEQIRINQLAKLKEEAEAFQNDGEIVLAGKSEGGEIEGFFLFSLGRGYVTRVDSTRTTCLNAHSLKELFENFESLRK